MPMLHCRRIGYQVLDPSARIRHLHRAWSTLLRYPDVPTRAFAVSSGHHGATPGPRCSTRIAWITLRLERAGFVAGASVVPLVTVDEGERAHCRDLDSGASSREINRRRHPSGKPFREAPGRLHPAAPGAPDL
jgi:hypothetical protein